MTYEGMIDKYTPKIIGLRNVDDDTTEMKADLIVMQIMDETIKDTIEKVGKLYYELISLHSGL